MRVNPKIRDTLKEISTQAIVDANTPSPDYKHLRRNFFQGIADLGVHPHGLSP
jgi:hypothetical protein